MDDTKKYPTNVSTTATASVPFSIRAIADNGTVNYYSAKLVMDGTELQVKFSGDILELGKGETKLSSLSFVNLAGMVMLPTPNTQATFDALF